jgi:glycine/D-amino acid oxidase-like deaminating enzyme
MGPLLGDLVAAEVAGGEASPLLADFRPGRFAVRG